MTRFQRMPVDPTEVLNTRQALLEQPDEFFRQICGYVPDLNERLYVVETVVQRLVSLNIYCNDTYRVEMNDAGPFVHLDIRRHDHEPCNNWHDFQKIKNELVGPEFEAVELFPAESRLVDTANQYHLWVHKDAGFRFPLGFGQRLVYDANKRMSGAAAPSLGVQQSFDSACLQTT